MCIRDRDLLAALHRRLPALRGFLTATSNAVRRRRGWVTTFEETDTRATLAVTYGIDGDGALIRVAVDAVGDGERRAGVRLLEGRHPSAPASDSVGRGREEAAKGRQAPVQRGQQVPDGVE